MYGFELETSWLAVNMIQARLRRTLPLHSCVITCAKELNSNVTSRRVMLRHVTSPVAQPGGSRALCQKKKERTKKRKKKERKRKKERQREAGNQNGGCYMQCQNLCFNHLIKMKPVNDDTSRLQL